MSKLQVTTIAHLEALALMDADIGAGVPTDIEGRLGAKDTSPEQLSESVDQGALYTPAAESFDNSLGDVATLMDEVDLLAGSERAIQSCYMSRVRHMAHHVGLATGISEARGPFRYSLQEAMVRPE